VRRVSRCFAFGFAFAFAFALCGVAPAGFLLPGAVAQSAGPSAGQVSAQTAEQSPGRSAHPSSDHKVLIRDVASVEGIRNKCAHRLWTGGGA